MTTKAWALPIFAIVMLVGFAVGETAPLTFAEYKSRLEQYSTEIQQVTAHPEHAGDFYREVPSTVQVRTKSGDITVSFEFLRHELDKYMKLAPGPKTAILSQLTERLNAMRAEADGFEHAHAGDPTARERLNRILSADEFGRVRGPTELELLQQRLSAWIRKQLENIFPTAPDLDQWGQIFVWIVIAIASAIFAVWLYRRSRERLLDRPREIIPFVPSAKGWSVWLAEAREKAALGQWRDAIRLGFWAAVSRLESDGVWRPDRARTPREYLNAIPADSGTKPAFAVVTKTFEASWYGGRPAAAGDFDHFVGELEKLGCKK